VQANYLASPPLVVAYALAGTVNIDLTSEPIGQDKNGNDVFLKDIWPSNKEIQEFIAKYVTREIFERKYADVFKGDENWQAVKVPAGQTYAWDDASTYVQNPPYFVGMGKPAGISATSRMRASSACSATRSPPTTSRPPVRSRRSRRPAPT
jgi:aconitate hydratase